MNAIISTERGSQNPKSDVSMSLGVAKRKLMEVGTYVPPMVLGTLTLQGNGDSASSMGTACGPNVGIACGPNVGSPRSDLR